MSYLLQHVRRALLAGRERASLVAATNLVATGGDFQISLTWNDLARGETGYSVEVSDTGGGAGFSELATTSANATSYVHAPLPSLTTKFYRVRPFNGSLYGDYSNEATATTNL